MLIDEIGMGGCLRTHDDPLTNGLAANGLADDRTEVDRVTREIAMQLVTTCGLALQHLPSYQRDIDVCRRAMWQDHRALCFVSPCLRPILMLERRIYHTTANRRLYLLHHPVASSNNA